MLWLLLYFGLGALAIVTLGYLIWWLKKRRQEYTLSLTHALAIVRAIEKRKLSEISIEQIPRGHCLQWTHKGLDIGVTIMQRKSEDMESILMIATPRKSWTLNFLMGELQHNDDADLRVNKTSALKALTSVANKVAERSERQLPIRLAKLLR